MPLERREGWRDKWREIWGFEETILTISKELEDLCVEVERREKAEMRDNKWKEVWVSLKTEVPGNL